MNQQDIAGRSCAQWNRVWKTLEGGLLQRHEELGHDVGVFRIRLGKEVVYIGCGREYANGGLMKRLFDFVRKGDSGRKHSAGRMIYEQREALEVDVIITGNDYAAGVTAQQLKNALVASKKPTWNAT